MREKFTFENPGKNALMAEILARRNRQPRMTFLTSLTAVMAAAISLTAVCGSLPANAIPVEQPSQPEVTEVTEVIAEHSAETPPAEIVTRVHTETKIEPVTEYHELVLTPAAVSQADADVAAYPETGTSLFSQEQQRYQWQFGDEIFTFFVKAETLYRRSETTGKITAVYRGEGDISLLCVTDRYLFFKADVLTTDVVFGNYTAYCYRADLLTGDILRLFNCESIYAYQPVLVEFVRFDGTDVVFNTHIVHEDGSYEHNPDQSAVLYDDNTDYTDYSDNDNENNVIVPDESFGWFPLSWNQDYSLVGRDEDNCYDLGVSLTDIQSFCDGFPDGEVEADSSVVRRDGTGLEEIGIVFGKIDSDHSKTYLLYYGRISDNGVNGVLIQAELTSEADAELDCWFTDFDVIIGVNYFKIPVDFDRLLAASACEPEHYSVNNGEAELKITYRPCRRLPSATPDSAG